MKNIYIFTLLFVMQVSLLAQSKVVLGEEEIRKSPYAKFENRSDKFATPKLIEVDKEIGKGLHSKIIESGKPVSYKGFSVRRFYSDEQGKFGGDILSLNKNATYGHINSIKRILHAYIQSSFEYTEESADKLVLEVLYYNAKNRAKLTRIKKKYTKSLIAALDKRKVGISKKFSDWPGNTQIVIPIKSEADHNISEEKSEEKKETSKSKNEPVTEKEKIKLAKEKIPSSEMSKDNIKISNKSINDKKPPANEPVVKEEKKDIEIRVNDKEKDNPTSLEESESKNPEKNKTSSTTTEEKPATKEVKREEISKDETKKVGGDKTATKDEKPPAKETKPEEKPATKEIKKEEISKDETKKVGGDKTATKDEKPPVKETKPEEKPATKEVKKEEISKDETKKVGGDKTATKDVKPPVKETKPEEKPVAKEVKKEEISKDETKKVGGDKTATKDVKPPVKETKPEEKPVAKEVKKEEISKDETKKVGGDKTATKDVKPPAKEIKPEEKITVKDVKKDEPSKSVAMLEEKADSKKVTVDKPTAKEVKPVDPPKKEASSNSPAKKVPEKIATPKEEIKKLKEEIAVLKTKEQDKVDNSDNVVGEKIVFLKVKEFLAEGHYSSEMWALDTENDDVLFQSPFKKVCGKEFKELGTGVVVMSFKENDMIKTDTHHLALLDKESLKLIKQTDQVIFWRSFLKEQSGKLYAVEVKDGKYYLAQFKDDMTFEMRSSDPINPDCEIAFKKNKIYLTKRSPDNSGVTIRVLNRDNLKLRDIKEMK